MVQGCEGCSRVVLSSCTLEWHDLEDFTNLYPNPRPDYVLETLGSDSGFAFACHRYDIDTRERYRTWPNLRLANARPKQKSNKNRTVVRFRAKREHLEGLKDFHLKAKAGIWPWLSHLWHIRWRAFGARVHLHCYLGHFTSSQLADPRW